MGGTVEAQADCVESVCALLLAYPLGSARYTFRGSPGTRRLAVDAVHPASSPPDPAVPRQWLQQQGDTEMLGFSIYIYALPPEVVDAVDHDGQPAEAWLTIDAWDES